ncbi:MAG: hypothetical protein J0M34_09455 [Alphaproteobacteria bacterium]|nr:hypothetical protein [Alphaproteobacteria bacterium]
MAFGIGAVLDWATTRYEKWRFAQSVGDANQDGILEQREIMAALNNNQRQAIDRDFAAIARPLVERWYMDVQVQRMLDETFEEDVSLTRFDNSDISHLNQPYIDRLTRSLQDRIDVYRYLPESSRSELLEIARDIRLDESIEHRNRSEVARGMLGMARLSADAVQLSDMSEIADRLLSPADEAILRQRAVELYHQRLREEREAGRLA